MPAMAMNHQLRARFGRKLRALRTGKALRQDELGKALGYSKSMVSEIEHGHQAPPLDKAFAIAEYFGVTIDELVRQRPRRAGGTLEEALQLIEDAELPRPIVARLLRALAGQLQAG